MIKWCIKVSQFLYPLFKRMGIAQKATAAALLFYLTAPLDVNAVDLYFRLTPEVVSPSLTGGTEKYSEIGFGGMLNAGISFLDFVNLGSAAGFYAMPKQSSEKLQSSEDSAVFFIPMGLQLGAYAFPFSRLELSASFSGGPSIAYTDGNYHYQPWYRAEAGAAFRINPAVSLGLNVAWQDYQFDSYASNPLMEGVSAGVTIQYRLDTKKAAGNILAEVKQEESIFPLFYTIYKNNYFGSIIITNEESAEIRNVRVRFRAEGYTASELECGKVSVIRKHRAEEIPLKADFNESILNFTENGQISGEVIVEYELLGQKRESVSQVIIPVYNRNQVRWTDTSVIASYVSSSSQEVLEFSKYLVGVARRYLRSGLNRNMQFAMYVFEGMRLAGLKYEVDSTSPYDKSHVDPLILDSIQYPFQTMLYKTGDKDELGILFMSLLQSVGIKSAFITTADDFIVLFNTEINISKASNFFDGMDRVLVFDDEVYVPLSMKALSEGFVNSWYTAVVEVQKATEAEEEIGFVNITEAWAYYPPAAISTNESVSMNTSEKKISEAVETDIARYITAEFGPQIAAVQNRIKAEGASVNLYNKLGLLYVRAGMYSSAIPVYQLSAKMGSVSAMNNLGNIATLQKKYEEALAWYKKVLEIEPDNKTAKKNLTRIESELEESK